VIKVLHISISDHLGGAEMFANTFAHSQYFDARLVVQTKKTSSAKVTELPLIFQDRLFLFLDKILFKVGIQKTFKQLFSITEKFNFTYKKLHSIHFYKEADIVHLHNIHGGYFDLDALKKIAAEKPIVWTLHDMWAITGGEAHTFGNKNYVEGIGKTPYADAYPLRSPWVDLRDYYLKKKKNLYKKIASRTVWIPASYWLEKCVRESYVFNENMRVKTIHYGIDLQTFRNNSLRTWKWPRILFFNSKSPFKGGYVFTDLIPGLGDNYELVVVGDKLKTEPAHVTYLSFFTDRNRLAELYNSIDMLVFPSKADTFPFTVLEAMACGVCVIGADVCGITEQLSEGNGILFKGDDNKDLREKLKNCFSDLASVRKTGEKASINASKHYTLEEMYRKYEEIYTELVQEA
jgi:glycosyltransferase involved in cell wall biosynthesis